MYSVYFDNILQAPEDIINIDTLMETSIVREDGFNSTEQIIREKCEMQMEFTGSAYTYIRDKIIENTCFEIQFKIEDSECGYIYNGIIPVTSVELSPAEWIGKTSIKDNSFSGYIRDYLGVKVDLFNTKTKDCSELQPINGTYRMYKTYNNTTDYTVITAFDVLDALKYMVYYLTDNLSLIHI